MRGLLVRDLAVGAYGSCDAASGGDPGLGQDAAPGVVGKVGHPDADAGSGPGQPDRANRQSHGMLLHREDVLDRRPVAGAPGIATADVRWQRPPGWAAPVDSG